MYVSEDLVHEVCSREESCAFSSNWQVLSFSRGLRIPCLPVILALRSFFVFSFRDRRRRRLLACSYRIVRGSRSRMKPKAVAELPCAVSTEDRSKIEISGEERVRVNYG